MRHYGNRKHDRVVANGDLVTFRSVGAGPVKAIVTDTEPPAQHPLMRETRVEITVTSQTNPIYRRGDVLRVSATWLTYRRQSARV